MGGYLKLMAVLPGRSRRGAGTRLLTTFAEALVGSARHGVLSGSDFNASARASCRRHGRTRVGAWPGPARRDVAGPIYWKRLRPR